MTLTTQRGECGPTMTEPTTNEPTYSKQDLHARNHYLREFLPFMLGYGVVLVAALTLVNEDTPGRAAWHLLPAIPLAGAMWAYYRQVRRADEYSRQLQINAMAIGFGAILATSIIFGFLAVGGLVVAWSPWIISGAGFLACFGSLGFMARD